MVVEPAGRESECELCHTNNGIGFSVLLFEEAYGLFVRTFRWVARAAGTRVCGSAFLAQTPKQRKASDGDNDDDRDNFLCTDSHFRLSSRS